MKRLLDLFCGRWGWSKAFAARGWECIGVDIVCQRETMPNRCDFWRCDILKFLPRWFEAFDFIVASPPCEEFSVHCMKHFHKNPKYPKNGIKLFNHTLQLCEESGLLHVIENVRAAQQFVGPAVNHAGSFYLWGNAVPAILPMVGKGFKHTEMFAHDRTNRPRVSAIIPPELANCVADYAERLLEQRKESHEAKPFQELQGF